MRSLESKNKLLEAEIEALRSRYARSSGVRQLYESQLKDLHRVAKQMRVQRVREIIHNDRNIVVGCDQWFNNWSSFSPNVQDTSLAAKEAMFGQLDSLKAKYEEAVVVRKEKEQDIEALRPVRNSRKSIKNFDFSTFP